jgi:hypothetical protein
MSPANLVTDDQSAAKVPPELSFRLQKRFKKPGRWVAFA